MYQQIIFWGIVSVILIILLGFRLYYRLGTYFKPYYNKIRDSLPQGSRRMINVLIQMVIFNKTPRDTEIKMLVLLYKICLLYLAFAIIYAIIVGLF